MSKLSARGLILLLFCLLLQTGVWAQNWEWVRNGPGARSTNIKGIAITLDRFYNHIIITGIDSANNGFGIPPVSFYVSKYDQFGNLLWQRECKGTKHGFDIETDSKGNIYFVCASFQQFDNSFVYFPSPYGIVKLDPNGKLLWIGPISSLNRGLIFELSSFKAVIEIDNADNLFFGASINTENVQFLDSSYSFPAVSSGDVFVAKFDTTGKVKWTKRFMVGGGNNGRYGGVFDIDVNQTGKIAIAGFFDINILINGQTLAGITGGSNPSGRTSFLAVLNTTNGNTVFANRYVSDYTNNYITGVLLKDNGNVVSCARVRGGLFLIGTGTFLWGGTDIFFTNSSGTDNPSFKQMTGQNNYHYQDFEKDNAGNIYASCTVAWGNNGNPNDSFNIRIQKFDTAGNFLQQSTIDVQNKYAIFYGHIKVRDSVLGVTGSVVPRFGNIRIGNNLIVGGPDTIYTFVGSIRNKSCIVTGKVYYDLNGNNNQEQNEPGLPYRLVEAKPGTAVAYTLSNGDYKIFTDTGTFIVRTPYIPRYHTVVPLSYLVSFTNYYDRIDNKNFALQPIPNIRDLQIELSAFGATRPGFSFFYYIQYANTGTTTLSGTYGLKFTSYLDLLGSDSVTSFVNADSASWTFSNLSPGQVRHNIVRMRVKPTTQIGTIFMNYATIFPMINDTIPADNIDSARIVVRGSFDPNDKLVDPAGPLLIDSVQTGKHTLEYMIRFQNTGNDTAFQVRVRDTLSSKLDIHTLEIASSSHPFILSYKASNMLEFYFPNILLPDSNINEPGSHGFIKFHIKPLTSVLLTDTIRNTASIYFDYNLPVRTNATVTPFRVNIVTGFNDPSNSSSLLKLSPNPTNRTIFYELKKAVRGVYRICIYDLEGRIIFSTEANSSTNSLKGEIAVDFLPRGLYILEINGKTITARKKFLKL